MCLSGNGYMSKLWHIFWLISQWTRFCLKAKRRYRKKWTGSTSISDYFITWRFCEPDLRIHLGIWRLSKPQRPRSYLLLQKAWFLCRTVIYLVALHKDCLNHGGMLTWTALPVQCVIRWLSHLWFPDTVSTSFGLIPYLDLLRTLTDRLLFIFIGILY